MAKPTTKPSMKQTLALYAKYVQGELSYDEMRVATGTGNRHRKVVYRSAASGQFSVKRKAKTA
jgi:hypothetical protein